MAVMCSSATLPHHALKLHMLLCRRANVIKRLDCSHSGSRPSHLGCIAEKRKKRTALHQASTRLGVDTSSCASHHAFGHQSLNLTRCDSFRKTLASRGGTITRSSSTSSSPPSPDTSTSRSNPSTTTTAVPLDLARQAIALERLPLPLSPSASMTLVQPADIDAVLDMYIAKAEADPSYLERDPYWCRPWPSSLVLARHIMLHPELVRGKSVADFGCGLGIAGIAAALAGASRVVFLDREPLALHCALMSACASGVGPEMSAALPPMTGAILPAATPLPSNSMLGKAQGSNGSGGKLPSEAADHEGVPNHAATGPEQNKVHASPVQSQQHPLVEVVARLYDWSAGGGGEMFDVVMACDVLYEEYSVAPIAKAVPALLAPGKLGTFLLADAPDRKPSNRAKFLELMGAAGFVAADHGVRDVVFEGKAERACLLSFTRG
eukprot:jgi/Mesvir1/22494/Mv18529-RA.1